MKEKVAVLGASSKEERYSYKAIDLLQKFDHTPIPVSIRDEEILGCKAYKNISEIEEQVDTVTLYVNPKILEYEIDNIVAMKPKRVIMNPGTESPEAAKRFEDEGIRVVEACTLVLLKTDQYQNA